MAAALAEVLLATNVANHVDEAFFATVATHASALRTAPPVMVMGGVHQCLYPNVTVQVIASADSQ